MAPPGPANDSRLLNQPRPLCVCVSLQGPDPHLRDELAGRTQPRSGWPPQCLNDLHEDDLYDDLLCTS